MIVPRTAAAALALVAATAVAQAETVIIGMPDWPSAQVTAHIIAGVVKDGLGHDVKLREVSTVEIIGAIDRGEVDVHPEVWLPNSAAVVHEYQNVRGTLSLSPRSVAATQHICTTRQTQDETGISNLSDLSNPDVAQHFDTDADGRGEVWIGANTWSSTRIERVRAKSYGYDETMMLLTMPEDQAMASVDVAVALGTPIVFYCYTPHYLFALHDVVPLSEPAYDPQTWTILTPEEDPAWLARSEAKTAWQPARYHVGYATALKESHGDVAQFLDKLAISADDAEAMSYAVHVDRKDPQEVAAAWLSDNAARVTEWTK
ncbi:MAG: glycine betaine ABC transporter substrate-binding protein [Pseudomonadota bacterium]